MNLRVVGFGKAVLGMAAAATDLLAGFIIDGVLSLPHGISHIGKDYLLFFPFLDKAALIENFVEGFSQCCGSGSGIGCFLTPGSQDHIFKSFLTIFLVKVL